MTKNPIPNPDFKHNPDGDDRIPLPDDLKHLEKYGITAHKYGDMIYLRGAGFSTHILDEFLRKRNNKESVVIAVTGPPGTGKTYIAMALALIFDPKFNIVDTPPPDPKNDKGQVAFKRQHVLHLTGMDSPLKRGQAIVLDETHFGVGSRSWGKAEQQQLTNYIAAIRSKGIILILVVLHTKMLDKLVRDYVINYEIHVKERGVGIVYRRWFPQFGDKVFKKRLGKIVLPMPDYDLCNYSSCLDCKHIHPKNHDNRCITLRAIYERRKRHFLDEQSIQQEKEAKKSEHHTIEEVLQGVIVDPALIAYKPSGSIHRANTISNLREKGFRIKIREEATIINKLKDTYG